MKKYRERTLKQIMLSASFFLFLFPLLLMWIFLLWTTSRTIRRNILQDQQKIVQLTGTMVNSKLAQMEQTLQRARMDDHIQSILYEVDFHEYNSRLVGAYEDLEKFSVRLKNESGGDLDNVIFCNNSGDLYYNSFIPHDTRETIRSEWISKTRVSPGEAVLVDTEMKNGKGEQLITIGQTVIDIRHLKFIGTVFLCYKKNTLEGLLGQENSAYSGTFLITEDGAVIAGELSPAISGIISDYKSWEGGQQTSAYENRIFFSIFDCGPISVKAVRYFSVSGVMEQLYLEQMVIMLPIVGVILLFGLYVLYISRKIYRPLKKITEEDAKLSDCYELNQINDTIMTLTRKNQDGQEEIVRLVDKCRTTTIDKLQAQINPHFLYNTLSTIKYIAILNHQDKIS